MTNAAEATKKVFVKASVDEIEGTLHDVRKDVRGNYHLIFADGQSIVMPGAWRVPFDIYEGQRLHAKWESGRFTLEDLDALSIQEEYDEYDYEAETA